MATMHPMQLKRRLLDRIKVLRLLQVWVDGVHPRFRGARSSTTAHALSLLSCLRGSTLWCRFPSHDAAQQQRLHRLRAIMSQDANSISSVGATHACACCGPKGCTLSGHAISSSSHSSKQQQQETCMP